MSARCLGTLRIVITIGGIRGRVVCRLIVLDWSVSSTDSCSCLLTLTLPWLGVVRQLLSQNPFGAFATLALIEYSIGVGNLCPASSLFIQLSAHHVISDLLATFRAFTGRVQDEQVVFAYTLTIFTSVLPLTLSEAICLM